MYINASVRACGVVILFSWARALTACVCVPACAGELLDALRAATHGEDDYDMWPHPLPNPPPSRGWSASPHRSDPLYVFQSLHLKAPLRLPHTHTHAYAHVRACVCVCHSSVWPEQHAERAAAAAATTRTNTHAHSHTQKTTKRRPNEDIRTRTDLNAYLYIGYTVCIL